MNDEARLQLEYIQKLKNIINKKTEISGKAPTCHVTTFGCQMNTEHAY